MNERTLLLHNPKPGEIFRTAQPDVSKPFTLDYEVPEGVGEVVSPLFTLEGPVSEDEGATEDEWQGWAEGDAPPDEPDEYISDIIKFIQYWVQEIPEGKKNPRQSILKIWYRDRFGNPTERRIECYEIRWPYLWAYSLEPGTSYNPKEPEGKGIRMFRLDRIREFRLE